jgi:hypothetical protein
MKKFRLFLFVLVLFSLTANAQNEKFFRFGLLGESGYAWLKPNTKNLETKGGLMGLGYGMLAEFTLADNYSFASGIRVAYSGGKLQYTDQYYVRYPVNETPTDTNDYRVTRTYNLQYFEIPLCLKMKTNEIGYITYWATIGTGIGFKLKASADDEVKDMEGNGQPSNTDIDIKSEINFFRVPFNIGAGIEYSLGGTTSILAGLQFNNGLLDVLDGDDQAINNYLTLQLGILF